MNLTTKEQDTFLQNVVDTLASGGYAEGRTIERLLDIIACLDDIATEFQEQLDGKDTLKEVFEAARIVIEEETIHD